MREPEAQLRDGQRRESALHARPLGRRREAHRAEREKYHDPRAYNPVTETSKKPHLNHAFSLRWDEPETGAHEHEPRRPQAVRDADQVRCSDLLFLRCHDLLVSFPLRAGSAVLDRVAVPGASLSVRPHLTRASVIPGFQHETLVGAASLTEALAGNVGVGEVLSFGHSLPSTIYRLREKACVRRRVHVAVFDLEKSACGKAFGRCVI